MPVPFENTGSGNVPVSGLLRRDRLREVQPEFVRVALNRAEKGIHADAGTPLRHGQVGKKKVRDVSLLPLADAGTQRFQFVDLVRGERHAYLEDEPPVLGWLTNSSPPLMVTAPSSANGTSFLSMICANSSACGMPATSLSSITV